MQDYDDLPETSWKIKQPRDDEVRENCVDTGECSDRTCYRLSQYQKDNCKYMYTCVDIISSA